MPVVAIDFETANEQRSSPCAIGLAWIEDGRITEVEHHYVRPIDMRFSGWNIAVHGIRPADVEDADEFPAVLSRLRDRIERATVIAHNAAFDISVMRRTCELYNLPFPCFDYICTVQVAKNTWPACRRPSWTRSAASWAWTSSTTTRRRTPMPAAAWPWRRSRPRGPRTSASCPTGWA
jgi:DNA polymerase III epsilon subunit-like protein